eukprot:944798_1
MSKIWMSTGKGNTKSWSTNTRSLWKGIEKLMYWVAYSLKGRTIEVSGGIFLEGNEWVSLAAVGEHRFVAVAWFQSDRLFVRVLHLGNRETFGRCTTRLVLRNGHTLISVVEDIQSIRKEDDFNEMFSAHRNHIDLEKDPTD